MIETKEHLLEIAHCPNFKNCEGTPCEKIVKSQKEEPKQIPEPWNGNLNKSKLLFLSSNPSINEKEIYPNATWNDDEITDFFQNRFSLEKDYVKDYKYPRRKDGYAKKSVRFWSSIRNIATKLLDDKTSIPGEHYTLMEIVRCKSRKENGVKEAMNTCTENYLDKTLILSNANTIIAVGAKSRDILQKKLNINLFNNTLNKIQIGDKERLIFTIPHPNSRKERKLEKLFQEEELKKIIEYTIKTC